MLGGPRGCPRACGWEASQLGRDVCPGSCIVWDVSVSAWSGLTPSHHCTLLPHTRVLLSMKVILGLLLRNTAKPHLLEISS